MVELYIEENINQLISEIFNDKKTNLKVKNTCANKSLFYNTVEKIIIKKNTTNE